MTHCLVDFQAPVLRSLTGALSVDFFNSSIAPTRLEWLENLTHLPTLTCLCLFNSMRSQSNSTRVQASRTFTFVYTEFGCLPSGQYTYLHRWVKIPCQLWIDHQLLWMLPWSWPQHRPNWHTVADLITLAISGLKIVLSSSMYEGRVSSYGTTAHQTTQPTLNHPLSSLIYSLNSKHGKHFSDLFFMYLETPFRILPHLNFNSLLRTLDYSPVSSVQLY